MIRSCTICLLALLVFSQCGLNFKKGNGDLDEVEFEIEDFDKIYVGGNYELRLIPAMDSRVVIETDENLLRYINVEQHQNALNINNVHKLRSSEGIFVDVYYTKLNRINSTGASTIEHKGILETEDLKIDLSGAGAIKLDVNTKSVHVEMSGAGLIELAGNSEEHVVHISGAGGLMAENLVTDNCDVHLSGLGGASVFVTEKLTASITGIGGITYSGNPKLIEKQITGLGQIKRSREFVEEENEPDI
jgi:hypothetical protein